MRKGVYYLIFSIFIGFITVLLGGQSFNNWRSQIGYLFKHTPLCIAENLGLIRVRRAHYSEELKFDGRVIGELVGFNKLINVRAIGKISN